MARAIPIFAACLLACGSEIPTTSPSCAEQATVADEYAIFSAALNYAAGSTENLAIFPETISSLIGDDDEARRKILSDAFAPPDEVIADMERRSKNAIEIDVGLITPAGRSVVALEPSDVPLDSVQGSPPWIDFQNRYGTALVYELSRPGIGCTDAVIARVYWCGQLCGQASWYVLKKTEDGDWEVVSVIPAWQS